MQIPENVIFFHWGNFLPGLEYIVESAVLIKTAVKSKVIVRTGTRVQTKSEQYFHYLVLNSTNRIEFAWFRTI